MTSVWLVAFVALWVLVLLQAFLLFGLMRQTGLLHARIASMATGSGATDVGLPVQSMAPDFAVRGLAGETIRLASVQGKHTLLMFVSPQCAGCHEAMPVIEAMQSELHDRLQVLLVSEGEVSETREKFVRRHGLDATSVLIGVQQADEIARLYLVNGTPFVFLIDPRGRVRMKGFHSPGFWERLRRELDATASAEPTRDGDRDGVAHLERQEREVVREAATLR